MAEKLAMCTLPAGEVTRSTMVTQWQPKSVLRLQVPAMKRNLCNIKRTVRHKMW